MKITPELTNLPSEPDSPQKPSQGVERLIHHQQVEYFGPIPPPFILEQYNKVIPGSPERILKMAEKQSDHRISMENQVIHWNITKSKGGMLCAVVISLYALYVAKEIAVHGNPYSAAAIAALNIGGLIGIALHNSEIQKREREAQRNSSGAAPK